MTKLLRPVGFFTGWLALAVASRLAADEPAPLAKSRPRSEQTALALEIRERVEELQTLRRERVRSEQRHQDELNGLRRQIEMLWGQLEPVESAMKKDREDLARFREIAAKTERSAAQARSWINLAADTARPFVKRAHQRTRTSTRDELPRRLTEYGQAAAWLDDREPTLRAKGLQQACRLFGEEWDPARSVEVTNAPVTLEDGSRLHHAWIIRFGNVSKVFISEDRRAAGVWSHDPNALWRLDLPEPARRQVDELVGVTREKRPPAVVPAPFFHNPAPRPADEK